MVFKRINLHEIERAGEAHFHEWKQLPKNCLNSFKSSLDGSAEGKKFSKLPKLPEPYIKIKMHAFAEENARINVILNGPHFGSVPFVISEQQSGTAENLPNHQQRTLIIFNSIIHHCFRLICFSSTNLFNLKQSGK